METNHEITSGRTTLENQKSDSPDCFFLAQKRIPFWRIISSIFRGISFLSRFRKARKVLLLCVSVPFRGFPFLNIYRDFWKTSWLYASVPSRGIPSLNNHNILPLSNLQRSTHPLYLSHARENSFSVMTFLPTSPSFSALS